MNIGIKRAIELNADYIGLFDQDSNSIGDRFFLDMVDILEKNTEIATIGPIIRDNKGKKTASKDNLEIFVKTINYIRKFNSNKSF